MAERLVSVPLWQDTLISGPNTSGPVTSTFYFGKDVLRAECLMFQVSSVTSKGDVGFFYAISPDGTALGSYADNTALLASTFSLVGTQSGWQAIAMPNFLTPYVQFHVSGTGSNPTDTRVWATLVLRMD